MTRLDRLIALDSTRGIVQAEAGLALGDLLRHIVPRGWFTTTTPGTRHATLGGLVANDVHGKNHHRAGSFGRGVRRLEPAALRSGTDRSRTGRGRRPVCRHDRRAGAYRHHHFRRARAGADPQRLPRRRTHRLRPCPRLLRAGRRERRQPRTHGGLDRLRRHRKRTGPRHLPARELARRWRPRHRTRRAPCRCRSRRRAPCSTLS